MHWMGIGVVCSLGYERGACEDEGKVAGIPIVTYRFEWCDRDRYDSNGVQSREQPRRDVAKYGIHVARWRHTASNLGSRHGTQPRKKGSRHGTRALLHGTGQQGARPWSTGRLASQSSCLDSDSRPRVTGARLSF